MMLSSHSSGTLHYGMTVRAFVLALIIVAANCASRHSSRHERRSVTKPEVLEADLPAEAVPQLLGSGKAQAEVQEGKQATLNVCIMTADFWGLKAAGGTATAYHLLAAVLAKEEWMNVTFLQVTQRFKVCQEAQETNKWPGLYFACLARRHFQPEVAEASPYGAISQAVIAWLAEQRYRFDIIHVHEWGGVFTDLITLNHFRKLQPGLRIAVEPHGGHVWSQIGEVNRPMDVSALRIDASERIANALNDIEISPTNYMLAYLRQRGWSLPNTTLVIPNVIPGAEQHALDTVTQKKVHRVAFFGRLEERKGIKMFVEAIDKLQQEYDILEMSDFEVYLVGPNAIIDMMESKKWLAAKTAHWKVKLHLRIDIPREEALEIVSLEGMLLILCSFIDNMPYVVAEAATKQIPFMVFDAGGVLELFDHRKFKDIIVKEATAEALAKKMHTVLQAGSLTTVKLADEVIDGRHKWLQFHEQFQRNRTQHKQEDEGLIANAKALSKPARIVGIKTLQPSLDLWEALCLKSNSDSDEVLLLLPHGYLLPNEEEVASEVGQLIRIAELKNSPVKALTFGIELPNKKIAFPGAPTWIAYAGDHQHCLDDVPIGIATKTFCNAFLGEARLFRYYNGWILAHLLERTNGMMHAHPQVFFKVKEYTSSGSSTCATDKLPAKRAKDYVTAASRLFQDAATMMHSMVLADVQKPLASLLEDAAPTQMHKGWQYGYLNGFANETQELNYLSWKTADETEFGEDMWGCENLPDSSFVHYPHFKGQLLHPCHHDGGKCCGGIKHAPLVLRFNSFLHADQAGLHLTYDAFPVCGDGFDFLVTHYPSDPGLKPRVLIDAGYEPIIKATKSQRQFIEIPIDIRVGDHIDFVVEPRHSHDCDGLYMVEAKLWPSLESQDTAR